MTTQPFETIYSDNTTVACNGGGGALGHPRVYLHMGPEKEITCPYCSRHYVLDRQDSGSEPVASHS